MSAPAPVLAPALGAKGGTVLDDLLGALPASPEWVGREVELRLNRREPA